MKKLLASLFIFLMMVGYSSAQFSTGPFGDITVTGVGGVTYFDSTTYNDLVWGDGTQPSITREFDVLTGDPTVVYGNSSVYFDKNIYTDMNLGVGTTAPTATIDIGGGTLTNIDGTEDLLVKDDIEADGYIYSDSGFVGDGSQLTGIGASSGGWTNSGSLIYPTTTTHTVGVGTTNFTGKFAVYGDSDEVQVHVRANATQTANVLVFTDSTGTIELLTLDLDGNLSTGGTLTATGVGQSSTDEGFVCNEAGGGDADDNCRFESNNEANFVVSNAGSGTFTVGDGSTNYVQTTESGTVTFVGAANIKPNEGVLSKGFTLSNPLTTDTLVPLWTPNLSITFTRLYCVTTADGTATVNFTDDTNDTDQITCVSAGEEDNSLTNASYSADETIYMEVQGIGGTVPWVNLTGDYTID